MKNKKTLIVIILVAGVIVALTLAFFLLPNKETNNNTAVNNTVENKVFDGLDAPDAPVVDSEGNDCTKKGNVCDKMQIGQGILKSVQVNDKETIDFYMISNDENTMTLISKDVLFKSKWSDREYNFHGPETLFKSIYENTKTWTNVKPLEYEYTDLGNANYNEICGTDFKKTVGDYECIIGQNGVGYTNFKIDNKGYHFKSGFGRDYNIGNGKVYARTLTFEEANNLLSYNYKIKWLTGTDPFWTMTSDSEEVSSIIFSAYNMEKDSKATTDYVISFRGVSEMLGVRPVITIDK